MGQLFYSPYGLIVRPALCLTITLSCYTMSQVQSSDVQTKITNCLMGGILVEFSCFIIRGLYISTWVNREPLYPYIENSDSFYVECGDNK
jgi:hypothetical protein